MATLGVITCEMLELEFAYLLANDPDVSRLTVVEDAKSRRLVETLSKRGRDDVRRIPHISAFRPEPLEPLETVVRVLEMALHRTRDVLRHALRDAAREMAPRVDALVLGYGLCGNALENPKEALDVNVPIFIPMDEDRPVDDCVGLLLGGRKNYLEELVRIPGTFFMTPGWSRHWKQIFGVNRPCPGLETIKRVFSGYERSLLVLTPVLAEEEIRREAEAFSAMLDLRVETRQGTIDLLREAWSNAKTYLTTLPGPSRNAHGESPGG